MKEAAKDSPPATTDDAPIEVPAEQARASDILVPVLSEEKSTKVVSDEVEQTVVEPAGEEAQEEGSGEAQEEQKDIPQPSIEVYFSVQAQIKSRLTFNQDITPVQEPSEDAKQVDDHTADAEEVKEGETKDSTDPATPAVPAAFGTGFGFPTGGFPMGFGGDMNPFMQQQMMMMQNGMPGMPNGFGFPMMGTFLLPCDLGDGC